MAEGLPLSPFVWEKENLGDDAKQGRRGPEGCGLGELTSQEWPNAGWMLACIQQYLQPRPGK